MDEAIALVHAGEVQQQDFRRISDGQRQRLMLARAICQDTQVLILDEPTSYLDMGFKLDILTTIRMLARKKNLAVIMSLHELDLAQKISDTIACVKGDRIDRVGTPEEIFPGTTCSSCTASSPGSLIRRPGRFLWKGRKEFRRYL